MRALQHLSVSPLFCSYLSLSLHLLSSSFSPREQAVAKKQIGEPESVLDMLFFFFFPTLCDEFRTFSVGNVRENQSLPPSLTSFYFLCRSVPSLCFCLSLSLCWLQSKYTRRSSACLCLVFLDFPTCFLFFFFFDSYTYWNITQPFFAFFLTRSQFSFGTFSLLL